MPAKSKKTAKKLTMKSVLKTIEAKKITYAKLEKFLMEKVFVKRNLKKLGYHWEEGKGGSYHLVRQ